MIKNATTIAKILFNFSRPLTTAGNGSATTNYTNQAANESISQFIHTNQTSSVAINRTIDIAVAIPLIVIDFYLVLVTYIYCLRHSQNSLKWTNRICAVSAFVLLANAFWKQTEIFMVNITDEFCRTYTTLNLILSIGNRTLVYTVFWIRQRDFYKTFSILNVSMAKFNCVSNSLLAGIIILPILQIGVLSALPSYASEIGCKNGPEKPSKQLLILVPLVSVIVSLFQVSAFNTCCFLRLSFFDLLLLLGSFL